MTWRKLLGMAEGQRAFHWQIPTIVDRIVAKLLWLEKRNLEDTEEYFVLENAFDEFCEKI